MPKKGKKRSQNGHLSIANFGHQSLVFEKQANNYSFRSYFSAYKEEFENSEHQQETPETLLETIEKHEKEIKDKETSTALLNHIKEKKSEKIRQRQEKFDQRKKRDEDRRKAKGGLFLLCCKMN